MTVGVIDKLWSLAGPLTAYSSHRIDISFALCDNAFVHYPDFCPV